MPQQPDRFAVLRIPAYRAFQAHRFLLTIGLQMLVVVVGWHLYSLTHDPLSLGLTGLAEAIPAILIGIYGGHLADRKSRKRIVLTSIGALSFAAMIFAWLSTTDVWFAASGPWPINAVIFFVGIAKGYFSGASIAFVASLVPKELY